MSKQFYVVEWDGTENGPFPSDMRATRWAIEHDLVPFDSFAGAEKHIADHGVQGDDLKALAVVVERES